MVDELDIVVAIGEWDDKFKKMLWEMDDDTILKVIPGHYEVIMKVKYGMDSPPQNEMDSRTTKVQMVNGDH